MPKDEQTKMLENGINRLKEDDVNLILACCHWGIERENYPEDYQKEVGRKCIDWGADLVIGHHPHVIQPVEYIENADGRRTLVAYSLGNFISAQEKTATMLGGRLNFEIVKNNMTGGIAIENVTFSGIVTHYSHRKTNLRAYPLEDYTEELASKHGVHSYTSSFSLERLHEIIDEVIDKQFLK